MLRKTWVRVVLVLAVIVLGVRLAVWAAEPVTNLPTPPVPGRFTFTLDSDGHARVAHVVIPAGYRSDAPPPLVLLLHGGGGSGLHALEHDGWAAKADAEGFVLVAPDGLPAMPALPRNFRLNPAVWNSGQLRPGSPRTAIDDVAYFERLLDALAERVPHDPRRVFCAGHSNGGGMTLRAAAEIPERFAAVGMVAGLLAVDDPRPSRPVPTLYILGTADPLVPMLGGEAQTPWGTRQHPPVAEPLARWAAAIGCETEPRTVSDADGVRKLEYPSKSGGPTLTVLYLEGHGHNWPGAKSALSESVMGPNTSRLHATDVIWDFFEATAARDK